jgi:signal peptidase I
VTAFENDVDAAGEPPFAGRYGSPESGHPGDGTEDPTRRRGRRPGRRRKSRRKLPFWIEGPLYLVVTLVFTALIKAFFVQMYSIPSESMEPTTYKGDRVIVDQLSNWVGGEPARGQVVVFHDPHHWLPTPPGGSGAVDLVGAFRNAAAFVGVLPDQKDDLLIKRIIGVGGDTVECRTADGPVYVDGRALTETYINHSGTSSAQPCFNGVYKVTVPTGDLWVLGDNRMHSGDSAYNFLHQGPDAGFVPRSKVVGHVIGVISWLEDKRAPEVPPANYNYPGVVSTVPAP